MSRTSLPLWAWLACLIIVFTASFLRLHDINRLPDGLSSDESIKVMDAFHIAHNGVYPLYENFGSSEPMVRFYLSPLVALTGSYVVVDRIFMGFIGILTVATAFWATRCCLPTVRPEARLVAGLVAMTALTIALGHITLSRSLYRGTLLPLFMLLTLGFLMRGLHTSKWRDFVCSGLFLACGMFSYTSAYVTPLAFAALVLCLVFFRWHQWRLWLPRLLLTVIAALMLFSPVLLRLTQVPQSVLGRAQAVGGNEIQFQSTVSIMLHQLLEEGDQNPQYNTARAAVIPQAVQGVFFAGLLILLLTPRNPASWYLLTLFILTMVPAVASAEPIHGLRIVGLFGVFPVITGIGAGWIFHIIAIQSLKKVILPVTVLCLMILLFTQALSASALYTDFWGNADGQRLWQIFGRSLNHNEWFFRSDRRAFARWILEQPTPLLIPVEELNRNVTRSWLTQRLTNVRADQLPTIAADTRVVFPWELETDVTMQTSRDFAYISDDTIWLLPPLTEETHAALLSQTPLETIAGVGRYESLGYTVALPEKLAFETSLPIPDLQYGDDLILTGWRGATTLLPGGKMPFTLYWTPNRETIGHDYFLYVQVLTQNHERVAGEDIQILRWLYPTSQWAAEDTVPTTVTLTMPEALTPGVYRLVAGIYPMYQDPLPVLTPIRAALTNPVTIAWLKVPLTDYTVPPERAQAVNAVFGESFELKDVHSVITNNVATISLYWQSLVSRSPYDATIFVQVLDATGEIIAQSDERPRGGSYPTLVWDQGERIKTPFSLTLPPDSDPESLSLRIGMYTQDPDLNNLSVTRDEQPQPDSFIVVPLSTR